MQFIVETTDRTLEGRPLYNVWPRGEYERGVLGTGIENCIKCLLAGTDLESPAPEGRE